ncbi:MAG: hypothetical protein MHMPM18_003762 [Marteilia pararefringens]
MPGVASSKAKQQSLQAPQAAANKVNENAAPAVAEGQQEEEFEADWEKAAVGASSGNNNAQVSQQDAKFGIILDSLLPERQLMNKYSYDELEVDNLALTVNFSNIFVLFIN